MDANKSRINTILTTILEEKKDKIAEVDKKGEVIDARLKNLQKIVFANLKKQCFKEIKWIEEHGKLTRTDEGFKIHINDNPGIEADAHIKEFYTCSKLNDLGISLFFDGVTGVQNEIASRSDFCISKCITNSKDESDTNVKYCINSCVEVSLQQTEDIYSKINNKIDMHLTKNI